MSIQVAGRHIQEFKAPSDYTIDVQPGGVFGGGVIRIDDKTHLDFWLEIQLTREDLAKLNEVPYDGTEPG